MGQVIPFTGSVSAIAVASGDSFTVSTSPTDTTSSGAAVVSGINASVFNGLASVSAGATAESQCVTIYAYIGISDSEGQCLADTCSYWGVVGLSDGLDTALAIASSTNNTTVLSLATSIVNGVGTNGQPCDEIDLYITTTVDEVVEFTQIECTHSTTLNDDLHVLDKSQSIYPITFSKNIYILEAAQ